MTLPEVLAAMVLVAIVLPVAMQGISLSLQAAARARHTAEAAHLADSKLTELAVRRDAGVLDGAGDFGADWPEYRWESRSAAADHGLSELTVSVTWSERGAPRSAEVSTLVYPTSQGPP